MADYIKKCEYFNDHQTACVLMIDDFSLTATTIDGKLNPGNDWGFGLNNNNSLYKYFAKVILEKFPEIRGTIFLPIANYHGLQNKNSNYEILYRKMDQDFFDFLNQISDTFEVAYHGSSHGHYIQYNNPEIRNNWKNEFEYLGLNDINKLHDDIVEFEKRINRKLYGGKYPGYSKNIYSELILEQLGFSWWASSCKMMNKKKDNKHSYFGVNKTILDFPTNINGRIFKKCLYKNPTIGRKIKSVGSFIGDYIKEQYLQYLYQNKYIISIQEHFQNLRTDGTRQNPNVFDDVASLDRIYSTLRGCDIWYTTCTELSHYLRSYDFSNIEQLENGNFELICKGAEQNVSLSICSNRHYLVEVLSDKIINGIYKNGKWIYNNVLPGIYKFEAK